MRISARGISFGFKEDFGLLDGFCVEDQGRTIAPLHRAPWVGSGEEMPPDAAPHHAVLGGDFFCAPFGAHEGSSPLHGWPPNSPWHVTRAEGGVLEAELERKVFGATLRKRLALQDGHPFVYQSHTFGGGTGRVSCANHANVSVKTGAHIRTSTKAVWETPATPQESDPSRGRSALIYPAQVEDPAAFPGADGPVDLTRYPWRERHEDFAIGLEASGRKFGWTAVSRLGSGDLFLSLRNTIQLPMTMLWHSNGGRDYAPWSGRHLGCLGVEEGIAGHLLSVSKDANLLGTGEIELGKQVVIRHVIGAISWPTGEPVGEVVIDGETLVVTGETGAVSRRPFDAEFLEVAR